MNNRQSNPPTLSSTSTVPSSPIKPSRFLTDLLRPPQANNASYLLTLAQSSLSDLYNTQITINQVHAETRKRFVIARAWFDELSAEGEGLKAQGEGKGGVVIGGTGEKSREAKMVYERALGELEMRRKEVLRVKRDVAVLKGDVAFLTKLVMKTKSPIMQLQKTMK